MNTELTTDTESRTAPVPRALFADGIVLPEQLAHSTSFLASGSGRLMKAVLEDAIECFLSQNQELRSEAAIWIFAEENDHPFSFQNICEALGIAPEAFRVRLASQVIRVAA